MAAAFLLHRLRERKLVQWAIAYLAGTWALVEATNLVVDQFHWPEILGQVVTVAAFFGFFVTLVLAWYHGEKGYQRVRGSELLVLTVLMVAAGFTMSQLDGGVEAGEAAEAAGLSEMARFAAAGSDRPTIAVLPLANLSADPENGYFAAGIHEELLRQLSLVRALAVISRTSVLQYAGATKSIREIAGELGARYVVEGSVQQVGDRVRIQAQLIDAVGDHHLWAERYDRSMDDLLQVQSEIAQAIAQGLQTSISPEELTRMEALPTQDAIAYDFYLQGISLGYARKDDYDASVDLLRRATTLDPDFALAHATLAMLFWSGRALHGYPPSDSARTRAARAVEIAPQLPQALSTRGFLLASAGEYGRARTDLRQALELNPSLASAWTGLAAAGWWSGDPVAGALAARRGVKVDPRQWSAALHMSYNLVHVGMSREAMAWAQHVLETDPGNIWALNLLPLIALSAGDLPGAREDAQRQLEAGGRNPWVMYTAALVGIGGGDLEAAGEALREVVAQSPSMNINSTPTAQALLAWVEDRRGVPGARGRLEELVELRAGEVPESPHDYLYADLALLAAACGDGEGAARWLQEANRLDSTGDLYLVHDLAFFDGLRERPEFQAWVRETEDEWARGQRALAAFGGWMPEDVLGNPGG